MHMREFDVDCVVFDKDGTLIDFNALWGARTQRWVEAISASIGLTHKAKGELYSLLGYSPVRKQVRPESPLAVVSFEVLYTLAAGVICQAGIPWHQARDLAISCAQDTILAAIDPVEIRPKGDVVGLMRQLVGAQIRVAVVTSDDRRMTEATLELLGIKELINLLICGDDPVPNKPSPEALWQISTQLGIDVKRIMMVGDTLSDMQFAGNAGIAFRIGVTSSSGDKSSLTSCADAILTSIDEIEVR